MTSSKPLPPPNTRMATNAQLRLPQISSVHFHSNIIYLYCCSSCYPPPPPFPHNTQILLYFCLPQQPHLSFPLHSSFCYNAFAKSCTASKVDMERHHWWTGEGTYRYHWYVLSLERMVMTLIFHVGWEAWRMKERNIASTVLVRGSWGSWFHVFCK